MTNFIYRTGTITVTNGSKNVTASLTAFAGNVYQGDLLFVGQNFGVIDTDPTGDTTLTLVDNWAGATQTTALYGIVLFSPRHEWATDVWDRIREVLSSSTNILTGTAAPSNSIGVDGDYFLDTTNRVFYGPKASGVWPAGFGMVFPSPSGVADAGKMPIINPTGNGYQLQSNFTLQQRSGITTYGVPSLRSVATNQPVAFDVMPNGAPTDTGSGLSWVDVCDADILSANNPVGYLHLSARDTKHEISAKALYGGTLKPLTIGVGSTEGIRITTDNDVLLGGLATSVPTGANGLVGFLTAKNGFQNCYISSHADSGANSSLIGRKSRGTWASPTICADADFAFSFFAQAHDGVDYRNCGAVRFAVDGTPASGSMPGRVTFHTTPTGTTGFQERMRIDQAGNVGINGTTFGGGAKVLFIANATTVPTSNPTGGGILYVENGALKYRGSSGTVTTIGPA